MMESQCMHELVNNDPLLDAAIGQRQRLSAPPNPPQQTVTTTVFEHLHIVALGILTLPKLHTSFLLNLNI